MRVNEGDAMADAIMGAKIVHIRVREGETGLLFATSPDLEGLLVAEPTRDALLRVIPNAITQMYAACGVSVVVTFVDNNGQSDGQSWVAFPAEVAKRALHEMAAAEA
jgi:hypothetical protein